MAESTKQRWANVKYHDNGRVEWQITEGDKQVASLFMSMDPAAHLSKWVLYRFFGNKEAAIDFINKDHRLVPETLNSNGQGINDVHSRIKDGQIVWDDEEEFKW